MNIKTNKRVVVVLIPQHFPLDVPLKAKETWPSSSRGPLAPAGIQAEM